MNTVIVLENPRQWDFRVEGAQVVAARDYLGQEQFSTLRRAKVFNLCRHYRYQSVGYYVSLLAEARGHKPMPPVATIQDLRSPPIVRITSEDLDELIQRSLARLESDRFELSIYFGRNLSTRYDRLCQALFEQFPAPLLRAVFKREDGTWRLSRVSPIAAGDVPQQHRDFLTERARRYFARPHQRRPQKTYRYDLAVLVGEDPASDKEALQRFSRAAGQLGVRTTQIGRDDFGRLPEFDALFIRDTTSVDHYTYRFARRAAVEGLAVVDDPESIIRCTNKVYLAELFARVGVAHPRTIIVDRSYDGEPLDISFPCVVKRPDSSFSRGVYKANDAAELRTHLDTALATSELALVQRFIPSTFDWRIGILGGRPLYVCKYFMAQGDWRIMTTTDQGTRYGRFETIPLPDAPPKVLNLAQRATSPIGDSFYGVDIKETPGGLYVMEVNDNPSLESDVEDKIAGDDLYLSLARYFVAKIDGRGTA